MLFARDTGGKGGYGVDGRHGRSDGDVMQLNIELTPCA